MYNKRTNIRTYGNPTAEPFYFSATVKHPRNAMRFLSDLLGIIVESMLLLLFVIILPFSISKYAIPVAIVYALFQLCKIFPKYYTKENGMFAERVSVVLSKALDDNLVFTMYPEDLDAAIPKKLSFVFPKFYISEVSVSNDRMRITGHPHIYAANSYSQADMILYPTRGFTYRWLLNFNSELILKLDPHQEKSVTDKIAELLEG